MLPGVDGRRHTRAKRRRLSTAMAVHDGEGRRRAREGAVQCRSFRADGFRCADPVKFRRCETTKPRRCGESFHAFEFRCRPSAADRRAGGWTPDPGEAAAAELYRRHLPDPVGNHRPWIYSLMQAEFRRRWDYGEAIPSLAVTPGRKGRALRSRTTEALKGLRKYAIVSP